MMLIILVNKITFIFVKYLKSILFLLIIFTNQSNAFENNSYFIGHAYGYHGNKNIDTSCNKEKLLGSWALE